MKMETVFQKLIKFVYKDPINKELDRLARLPRYSIGETNILENNILLVDGRSFVHGYEEIFIKEIYKFESTTETPIIVDCGANIGLATIYFKRNYPRAKIIAFEPDPEIFDFLSINLKKLQLKDVELFKKAVWTNNDGVLFHQEGGFSGRIPFAGDNDEVIKVPSIDLHEVLEGYQEIDFLKIDIEGAEYEVVKGINNQLHKVKNIFIEYHSHKDNKQTLHELLEIISQSGFRYHIHEAFVRQNPYIDKSELMGMDLQLNIYGYR